jgi:hypothetical protein
MEMVRRLHLLAAIQLYSLISQLNSQLVKQTTINDVFHIHVRVQSMQRTLFREVLLRYRSTSFILTADLLRKIILTSLFENRNISDQSSINRGFESSKSQLHLFDST